MTLKFVLALLCVIACSQMICDAAAVNKRQKRAAYALPDGVEFYIGEIRSTFQCPGPGYYADTDNECRLFHVCVTNTQPNGSPTTEQYTFACGNQTVFNQFSLTCDYEEDAVPCGQSSQFYYLNELIGQEDAKLHSEQDIERAAQYGSRILTARVNAAADAPATERPTTNSPPARRRPSASRRVQANPCFLVRN